MSPRWTRRGWLSALAAAPWLGSARAVSAQPGGPAAAPPEANLPPVDFPRIAGRVVAALAPAVGERAVLFFDRGYYPQLALEIEGELARSGVEPILAVAFDPPDIVEASDSRPGAAQRQNDFVSWLTPVFARADLFLWLPARALHADTRLEHLLEGSRARGIHFHWILGLEGRSAEEIASLSKQYEKAILETDYAALSKEQDRLIGLLRGQELHLTSSDGTDLRLQVPRDAWFHKNDADMSKARAREAHSARDREMEFPAGALRFVPDTRSVRGRLVIRRVPTPDGLVEGVTIDFEDGHAVSFHSEKGEEAFQQVWDSIGGDVDKVGEIVLGTNPLLAGTSPSGELPYFGYGAGAVRVSLGDNWESGGENRTAGDRNWWLFLGNASLEADGRTLIRNGRLLAE
jgi:Thermophilic metalloprotease (M29)